MQVHYVYSTVINSPLVNDNMFDSCRDASSVALYISHVQDFTHLICRVMCFTEPYKANKIPDFDKDLVKKSLLAGNKTFVQPLCDIINHIGKGSLITEVRALAELRISPLNTQYNIHSVVASSIVF